MGQVALDVSMSLDGFIAAPTLTLGACWGMPAIASMNGRFETRRNGEGPWGDNPPFQVPCFVLTHRAREKVVKQGGTTFTFVTEGIRSALEEAEAAAGDKNVAMMGANTAQQYMKAGLVDEIQIHIVPVLLGQGIRLFQPLGDDVIELERVRALASPDVTHLRFRVLRSEPPA